MSRFPRTDTRWRAWRVSDQMIDRMFPQWQRPARGQFSGSAPANPAWRVEVGFQAAQGASLLSSSLHPTSGHHQSCSIQIDNRSIIETGSSRYLGTMYYCRGLRTELLQHFCMKWKLPWSSTPSLSRLAVTARSNMCCRLTSRLKPRLNLTNRCLFFFYCFKDIRRDGVAEFGLRFYVLAAANAVSFNSCKCSHRPWPAAPLDAPRALVLRKWLALVGSVPC